MTEATTQPIRRTANGSIDTEFYVRLGRVERSRAVRGHSRAAAAFVARLFRSLGPRTVVVYPAAPRDVAA